MCVCVNIYIFSTSHKNQKLAPYQYLATFLLKISCQTLLKYWFFLLVKEFFGIKFLKYIRQAYNEILSKGRIVKTAVYKESTLFQNSTSYFGEHIFSQDQELNNIESSSVEFTRLFAISCLPSSRPVIVTRVHFL